MIETAKIKEIDIKIDFTSWFSHSACKNLEKRIFRNILCRNNRLYYRIHEEKKILDQNEIVIVRIRIFDEIFDDNYKFWIRFVSVFEYQFLIRRQRESWNDRIKIQLIDLHCFFCTNCFSFFRSQCLSVYVCKRLGHQKCIAENDIISRLITAELTIFHKTCYIHVLFDATYISFSAYAQISMR